MALAMISIEAEEARKLSVDKMIDEFAEKRPGARNLRCNVVTFN